MKILISSSHSYPAQNNDEGYGLKPTLYPSSSAYATFDLLVRGLLELGHDVKYFLQKGIKTDILTDLPIVSQITRDVEINHRMLDSDHNRFWDTINWNKPYVISCHIHPKFSKTYWGEPSEKWICPSKFLAEALNINRYVYNGINPKDYYYSSVKEDLLLFMGSMEWGMQKGLDTAIKISQKVGMKLVVLGGAKSIETINNINQICSNYKNISYLGDVRGKKKAELLAKACCFIFPTRLDESFGLSMVEALVSGTPVICSDKGACPEIINSKLGFVCKTEADYIHALENIKTISSADCRKSALEKYDYHVMANNFIKEYQSELLKGE